MVTPVVTPPTTPDELTVATAVALLLHVPPVVVSRSVVVAPWHTLAVPVIKAGSGLTVTMLVAEHPVDV